MRNRILLLALSRFIGDPDMIDHCGLVSGGLCPKPSLGHSADNVIIPHDLTQLFCPGFTLAAGPPSGFTSYIVSYWGGILWRACNLTAFSHSLTGPVGQPFAFRHEGPGFNLQGGYLSETGILLLALSRYRWMFFCICRLGHKITSSIVLSWKDIKIPCEDKN